MNDFLSALHSPVAKIRARAADEAGSLHALPAEPALRVLLNDESPIVSYRGERRGIGEVRFTALTALQRILLHHGKPMDIEHATVRKVMFADEVSARFAAVSEADKQRVAARVEETLGERVRPDADDEELVRTYMVLQALDLVEYRRERVDPRTYATPLQEEVRVSQLVSPRPRPHLRVADLANSERVFGYVFRNEKGRVVLDFAEGPGSDDAVEVLTAVLQSRLREVVVENDKTVRNPDGSAQWGEFLDPRTSDAMIVLRSLRTFVERRYHATIIT